MFDICLDGDTANVCLRLEQAAKNMTLEEMRPVLAQIDAKQDLEALRSVWLLQMAQTALQEGDLDTARLSLQAIDPSKLDEMPQYLAKCYTLKAMATDADKLTQRDRLLCRALECFEKGKEAISVPERQQLELQIQRQRYQVLSKEGKYTSALEAAQKVMELSDSSSIDDLSSLWKLLLLMPYSAAKVQGLKKMKLPQGLDPGIYELISKLNRSQIVCLDDSDGLVTHLRQSLDHDQIDTVLHNLVEMNIVAVSHKFKSITIDRMEQLVTVQDLVPTLVSLALDRKVDLTIDEVARVVYFTHEELPWKQRIASFLQDVDKIAM